MFGRSLPLDGAEQTLGERSVAARASAEMNDAAKLNGKPEAVVLILVGPPGAGKSTFAEELMRRASEQWQRINQVSNGIYCHVCRGCVVSFALLGMQCGPVNRLSEQECIPCPTLCCMASWVSTSLVFHEGHYSRCTQEGDTSAVRQRCSKGSAVRSGLPDRPVQL